ncbi:MAG: PrgI family protein [Clostridiales bacterium]|jgi:hypothetical protein|nr:PrgI family protein [Clostridiales bacterium]
MAYTPVPRDLSKIKVKILFGLTLRQLVCFGCAAAVGVPVYFLTRSSIGNSSAVLLMIGVMLPAFFVAMYEKDGQPAERILINFVRSRWFFPTKRPYRTENFYSLIEKEGKLGSQAQKETTYGKEKTYTAKIKRKAK